MTELAYILFLRLVQPIDWVSGSAQRGWPMVIMTTYRRSCSVSNFLGFLGQHSHIHKPEALSDPLPVLRCGIGGAPIPW